MRQLWLPPERLAFPFDLGRFLTMWRACVGLPIWCVWGDTPPRTPLKQARPNRIGLEVLWPCLHFPLWLGSARVPSPTVDWWNLPHTQYNQYENKIKYKGQICQCMNLKYDNVYVSTARESVNVWTSSMTT